LRGGSRVADGGRKSVARLVQALVARKASYCETGRIEAARAGQSFALARLLNCEASELIPVAEKTRYVADASSSRSTPKA
jgi:hypothetical protein